MKPTTIQIDSWIVTLRGQIVEWEWRCGEGNHVKGPIHFSRPDAARLAQLHAMRIEELTSGDINRWEFCRDISMAEVYRRGYRIKKTRVIVPTRARGVGNFAPTK